MFAAKKKQARSLPLTCGAGRTTIKIQFAIQHCSQDERKHLKPFCFHEQHHGRNKPCMQDVVDALIGTRLHLSLATCPSGTAAPSLTAPSFKSVSLGCVLCVSEMSPAQAGLKRSVTFIFSSATSGHLLG
jgi:hypothetical protein